MSASGTLRANTNPQMRKHDSAIPESGVVVSIIINSNPEALISRQNMLLDYSDTKKGCKLLCH